MNGKARALICCMLEGLHGNDRLVKTQVVKFLYLADLEWIKATGEPLTGLRWRFHHFGPWDEDVDSTLAVMEREGEASAEQGVTLDGREYVLYGEGESLDGDGLTAAERLVMEHILRQYRRYPLRNLLDDVVYQTPPMRQARRGQLLNMRTVQQEDEDLSFVHGGSPWGGE